MGISREFFCRRDTVGDTTEADTGCLSRLGIDHTVAHVKHLFLADLQTLERERCASMDRAADASARMTEAAVPRTGDARERVLRQMLYHIGRWVYLLDAAQDVKEDMEQDNYNPVVLRYELRTPDITEIKQPLERTLERSLADICMAFDLLDAKRDADLIRNIIFLGMPLVTRQVLDGTYQTNGGWGRHGSL